MVTLNYRRHNYRRRGRHPQEQHNASLLDQIDAVPRIAGQLERTTPSATQVALVQMVGDDTRGHGGV